MDKEMVKKVQWGISTLGSIFLTVFPGWRQVLDKVSGMLSDVSKVEMHPQMEGRSMTMVLSPLVKS